MNFLKNTDIKALQVLTLFLIMGFLPAKADTILTQEFIIDADTTMEVVISGTLNSNIAGLTGVMDTALNINFNITTNEAVNNMYLRATVKDENSNVHSAFYCTNTSLSTSQSVCLIFSEEDFLDVTADSIANCKEASSITSDNPCTIAYPATVTISSGGTIQYVPNSGEGYFNLNVPIGESDLNMTLGTSPKAGTYDAYLANDCADDYEVTIYLDNIP